MSDVSAMGRREVEFRLGMVQPQLQEARRRYETLGPGWDGSVYEKYARTINDLGLEEAQLLDRLDALEAPTAAPAEATGEGTT